MGRKLDFTITYILLVAWVAVFLYSAPIIALITLEGYLGVFGAMLAISLFALDKGLRRRTYRYSLSISKYEIHDDGVQFEPKNTDEAAGKSREIRVFAWDDIGEYEFYEPRYARWIEVELILLDGDRVDITGKKNDEHRISLKNLFDEIRKHKTGKKPAGPQ